MIARIVTLALLTPSLSQELQAEEPMVFLSFEEENERTQVETAGTEVEIVPRYATHGDHSLKVTFQPQPYPLIGFRLKEAFPETDWSQYEALAFDLYNPQPASVGLFLQFFDETGARRTITCPIRHEGPAHLQTMPLGLQLKVNGLLLTGTNLGMVLTWDQDVDIRRIVRFAIFMERPLQPTTLYFDHFRFLPRQPGPLVDRFGQYTRREWPGKVHHETELQEAGKRDLEAAQRFFQEQGGPLPGRDRFGGDTQIPLKLQATGFFRVALVRDGQEVSPEDPPLPLRPSSSDPRGDRWWLVTPEGHPFFSLGITGVTMGDQDLYWRDGGESRRPLLEWVPPREGPFAAAWAGSWTGGPNFYKANLVRKYGEDFGDPWVQVTLHRLLSWGFTTIGGWSDGRLCEQRRLPYVVFLSPWGVERPEMIPGLPDVFDPQFAAWAEKAGEEAARRKDDPWLLGYFVDNELFWAGDWGRDENPVLVPKVLARGPESAAKRRLVELLKERYQENLAALNAAWGTSLESWEALLNRPVELPPGKAAADFSAFLRLTAETYYRTLRDAIKKHDPNHLYLGSRFAQAPREAVAAAGRYCDVVSFNVYAPELDPQRFDPLYELARRPFLIGEFSAGARDRGMLGIPFVATDTQEERGQAYQRYVASAARLPYLVGCHWFEYLDEAFLGRHDGHESFNTGFVDVCDNPYPELAKAATEMNVKVYGLLRNRN